MKKKKVVSKKTQTAPKQKEFKLIWWSAGISKLFVILLIITMIILVALTYTQYKYIEQLEKKKSNVDEIDNFAYEVVALEEYLEEKGLTESIADIYKNLIDENYDNIILQEGFVQGEKEICDGTTCFKKTLRFNQRKGKYIEFITEE